MIEKEAQTELCGTGKCDKYNMERSCFAAELCYNNQTPLMKLHDMQQFTHPFVAVCDYETDVYGSARIPSCVKFVGCVGASPVSQRVLSMFPTLPPHSIVISNLCVASNYRQFGIGRQLIQAVFDKIDKTTPVFLLVMKDNGTNTDDVIKNVFKERVSRLCTTYPKLNFNKVGDHKSASLFSYMGKR